VVYARIGKVRRAADVVQQRGGDEYIKINAASMTRFRNAVSGA
jgi:hypothetical protein